MKSRYYALVGAVLGLALGFQLGVNTAKEQYRDALGSALTDRTKGTDPTSMYGDDVVNGGEGE